MYWTRWNFHFIRAEFQTTRELAEQLLTLAQRDQDQALLLQAYLALGTTLFRQGEMVPARERLEQSLVLYDSQKHRFPAFLHPGDLGVASLSYAAWVLWYLGYPDQALQRSHEALTLAQELARPITLAFALGCAASLHQLRWEGETVKERAETIIALSSEQGLPHWLAWGTLLRGWVLAEQGKVEEGIAQMRQGLAAHRAIGSEAGRSGLLAQLARAYEQMGQAEEGLAVVVEALATVNKTGERMYEAELYRLRGQLTLQSKTSPRQVEDKSKTGQGESKVEKEAEECFLKAIELAVRVQSRWNCGR